MLPCLLMGQNTTKTKYPKQMEEVLFCCMKSPGHWLLQVALQAVRCFCASWQLANETVRSGRQRLLLGSGGRWESSWTYFVQALIALYCITAYHKCQNYISCMVSRVAEKAAFLCCQDTEKGMLPSSSGAVLASASTGEHF